MKPDRATGRWIRIVLTMVFGFMTLGHGPIMTFAHAAKHETASHSVPAHHTGSAHQHHQPDVDHHAPSADEPAVCNAFGCFLTVGAIAVEAPPQALMPIGKLLPPPLPAVLPVFTEPADPPPRFHG